MQCYRRPLQPHHKSQTNTTLLFHLLTVTSQHIYCDTWIMWLSDCNNKVRILTVVLPRLHYTLIIPCFLLLLSSLLTSFCSSLLLLLYLLLLLTAPPPLPLPLPSCRHLHPAQRINHLYTAPPPLPLPSGVSGGGPADVTGWMTQLGTSSEQPGRLNLHFYFLPLSETFGHLIFIFFSRALLYFHVVQDSVSSNDCWLKVGFLKIQNVF